MQLRKVASKEEESMSTQNYEPMQDPMESRPPKLKKESSTAGTALLADDEGAEEEEEIYLVRQTYGVLSILFSLAQTVILIIMMIQCGIAPININPMVGPYPGESTSTKMVVELRD